MGTILSIIISVYNTEKYMECCIDSVLCQSFSDIEVILVDDGSIDNSPLICDEYANLDKRIKVIHKENGGQISAIEAGLKFSTGDYITFVDSDDKLDLSMYECLMNAIKQNNSDIAVGGYVLDYGINIVNVFEASKRSVLEKNKAISAMFESRLFNWSLCDKIYKRSLFENLENWWYLDNPYGDDTELNWKLFNKSSSVVYVPIYGYHYFQHANSTMSSAWSQKRLVYIDRYNIIWKQMDKFDVQVKKSFSKCAVKVSLYNLLKWGYNLSTINDCFSGDIDKYNEYRRYIIRWNEYVDDLNRTEKNQLKIVIKNNFNDFVDHFKNIKKKIVEAALQNNGKLFIYGAGVIADEIASVLEENKICYEGVIVSNTAEKEFFRGKRIFSLEQFNHLYKKRYTILIAANKRNEESIIQACKKMNITNLISIGKYSVNY